MRVVNSHVNHHAPVSNGSTQKRSYNTDEAATQILRGGYRHYDRNGDGRIELSFTLDTAFTAQQKASIRKALQAWQEVTNIVFKERSAYADGSIAINADPSTSGGESTLPNRYYSDITATLGTFDASDAPENGDYFLFNGYS